MPQANSGQKMVLWDVYASGKFVDLKKFIISKDSQQKGFPFEFLTDRQSTPCGPSDTPMQGWVMTTKDEIHRWLEPSTRTKVFLDGICFRES